MQVSDPISAVTPPSTLSTPKDNPCLTRTTKIALAIFVSLAGFVFLPFLVASTLTAAVTIGAFVCCDENHTSVISTVANLPSPSETQNINIVPYHPITTPLKVQIHSPFEIGLTFPDGKAMLEYFRWISLFIEEDYKFYFNHDTAVITIVTKTDEPLNLDSLFRELKHLSALDIPDNVLVELRTTALAAAASITCKGLPKGKKNSHDGMSLAISLNPNERFAPCRLQDPLQLPFPLQSNPHLKITHV